MPRGAGFTKAEKLNLLSLGEGREVRPAQLKRWRTQLAAGELGGAKRKNKYTPRRGPHAAGIIALRALPGAARSALNMVRRNHMSVLFTRWRASWLVARPCWSRG